MCQKNVKKLSHLHVFLGVKFDYELSLRKLKNYPKDLLKTMLINFTRTGHELVSKFTINIGFTKT